MVPVRGQAQLIGDLAASGLSQALVRMTPAGLPIANNHAELRISMY
jgi:hypothetical protein